MVDVAARVEPVPTYTGPIFDGDTHIYEQADSWSRYLPTQYEKDWGFNWKVGKDGQYALYIGTDRKVEVSAGYFTEDGKAPPPGRMHEWLKARKAGKMEVDMRVPMTPDMTHLAPRVKKMDEFGVEACFLYCGNMVASISYLDQIEPAKAVLHAYNRWMLDEWKFNFEDRVYSCPLVTLEDLDWACQEAEWAIKNGTRMFLMPMGPYNNKAPADPAYDRFWSILNEAHCRVVYHVSEAIYMKSHMAVWGEPMQQSRHSSGCTAIPSGRSSKRCPALCSIISSRGSQTSNCCPPKTARNGCRRPWSKWIRSAACPGWVIGLAAS
jgi:hypothetical protein